MRAALARSLYAAALRLATPLYFARLWWRGRREPMYRQFWGERLGYGGGDVPDAPAGRVWLHAVSLGETLAARPLIEALRTQRPGLRLLLTHGTATGREAGKALLQPGDAQAWLPYDTPGAVRRFLRRQRPAVGVLMETEVWPALLHAAQDTQGTQDTQRGRVTRVTRGTRDTRDTRDTPNTQVTQVTQAGQTTQTARMARIQRAAAVPMVLANARLSERSLRKGQRLAALLRPAVASFRRVLAQTDADAQRLLAAGAAPAAVQVQGNLKFDLSPDPALLARGQAWRDQIHGVDEGQGGHSAQSGDSGDSGNGGHGGQGGDGGQGRRVVLMASSREGEEAELLASWRALRQPRPLLLLVPRHPQRFNEVAALVAASGLSLQRRSQWAQTPPAEARHADVWLGDSLGEMPLYYAAADVALLGGSFAPLGGHNLIEAAACACPLVLGPHTFNFAQAADLSLAAGAAVRADTLALGVQRAVYLAAAPERENMARQAQAFTAQHRGAAARMAAEILLLL